MLSCSGPVFGGARIFSIPVGQLMLLVAPLSSQWSGLRKADGTLYRVTTNSVSSPSTCICTAVVTPNIALFCSSSQSCTVYSPVQIQGFYYSVLCHVDTRNDYTKFEGNRRVEAAWIETCLGE